LSEELKQTTVPEDALIRSVIKDTECDTTAPMIAFINVQGVLSFVLADRLVIAENKIKSLKGTIDRSTLTATDL
jgi:hypothetical protein